MANGRPDLYPQARGASVAHAEWFRRRMATADGAGYVAMDVERERLLGDAHVATYATAIRQNADKHGKPLGVLGVFFDWARQADSIVQSVGLSEEEWTRSRCLLVDGNLRVIAASDARATLNERYILRSGENAAATMKTPTAAWSAIP